LSSKFKHTVIVANHFLRRLKSLDKISAKRVQSKIEELAKGYAKGKALHGPYKGRLAVRVGRYRIIYSMPKHCEIVLYSIEHRESAY